MILRIICIASYFFGTVCASEIKDDSPTKKHRVDSGSPCIIYHSLNMGDSLESVKERGLLSFPRAFELGLAVCNCVPKVKLEHRKTENDIHFTPQPDGAQIAYAASSNILEVYNGAYRRIGNWPSYNQSKISFIEYQKRMQILMALQAKYPDKKFALDPLSCNPISVKKESRSNVGKRICSKNIPNYEPEIVVGAGRIAPEQLIFLQ